MSLEFELDTEMRKVDSSLEEENEDDEFYEPAPIENILSENTLFPACHSSSNSGINLLKSIKREPEDYLELECSRREDNGDITPSPSPRIKHKRECAEVAKKKIKLEMRPGEKADEKEGGKSDATDSREGSCERSDCPLQKTCCISTASGCYSTRTDVIGKHYHHITKGEHVCTICYDDLWKAGHQFYQHFTDWKLAWSSESRCAPTLKGFIQDQILPYWLQCTICRKFRNIGIDCTRVVTVDDTKKFKCGLCDEPEEKCASDARENSWILSVATPPLLHNSPSLHYLRAHYFFDELGMSPVVANYSNNAECASSTFMSPFHIPEQPMAFCVRPDVMEYDEVAAFPEYSVEPVLYLALRNLIVTLWNLNPFQYLTLEYCLPYLICRGLSRIWYIQEMRRIYDYLSMKCIINYGILNLPKPVIHKGVRRPLEVIVVGGGISGLAAARQLRSMGASVKILEAKGRIGGRMQDDWSLGVAVGCGAQLITGIINNPIVLMCEQTGVSYRPLTRDCPMVDAVLGKAVDVKVDRMGEEHWNCIQDILVHWRLTDKGPDRSLMNQINIVHKKLLSASGIKWGDAEERAFQFHLGNAEFSCGTKLDDVSWRNWDQNEAVDQFAGAHALLTEGSSELVKRIGEGTDIRMHHEVDRIDWSTNRKKIMVHCKNGKRYTADKVLLALPLAVLQKKAIKFNPQLPEKKEQAMKVIGAGLIEKVAVRFPRCFWSSLLKKDGTLDYFSHVPHSSSERGLFNMFYDFSNRGSVAKNQQYVLMSYVCGDSVDLVNRFSDVEVVAQFVDTLKDLFPDEVIPDPDGYVVTHWGRDPHIGMSYSYVRVGGSGEHYDFLAESVNDKLYFCGECTNRFFPQTMTGAYISGLREASRIIESYRNEVWID